MKLIRAKINNFRLLKDLELDFSIDEKKPLTVIRAANETGKTTFINWLNEMFKGNATILNSSDIIANFNNHYVIDLLKFFQ